jgi:hypothetical protein
VRTELEYELWEEGFLLQYCNQENPKRALKSCQSFLLSERGPRFLDQSLQKKIDGKEPPLRTLFFGSLARVARPVGANLEFGFRTSFILKFYTL